MRRDRIYILVMLLVTTLVLIGAGRKGSFGDGEQTYIRNWLISSVDLTVGDIYMGCYEATLHQFGAFPLYKCTVPAGTSKTFLSLAAHITSADDAFEDCDLCLNLGGVTQDATCVTLGSGGIASLADFELKTDSSPKTLTVGQDYVLELNETSGGTCTAGVADVRKVSVTMRLSIERD